MYLSFSVVVDTPVECTRISVGHGEESIPVKRNLIKNFPSRCKMHIAYTVYTALYAEIIIFNCKNDGENKAIQLKPVMHSVHKKAKTEAEVCGKIEICINKYRNEKKKPQSMTAENIYTYTKAAKLVATI